MERKDISPPHEQTFPIFLDVLGDNEGDSLLVANKHLKMRVSCDPVFVVIPCGSKCENIQIQSLIIFFASYLNDFR